MLDRRIFDELLCHAAVAATYYKYLFGIRVNRHRHMCDHLIIYKLICVRKNNLAIQRDHFAKLI